MIVVLTFLLLTLASARVTRLITTDSISFPIRQRITKRLGTDHWLTYLIHCPFCTSVWVSLGANVMWVLATSVSWIWYLPGALAMSYLVAPVLQKLDEES